MSFLWLSGFGNISDSRLVHFGALFSFAAFLVSVGFRLRVRLRFRALIGFGGFSTSGTDWFRPVFELSKISVLSKITS